MEPAVGRSAYGTLRREFPKLLPLLWMNDHKGGKDDFKTEAFRVAYMDPVSRLVSTSFSQQIGTWCREHGVQYIGHLIEDDDTHTCTGSGLGHEFRGLAGQDMAGIDDIGGHPVCRIAILYNAEADWAGGAGTMDHLARELYDHQIDYLFLPLDLAERASEFDAVLIPPAEYWPKRVPEISNAIFIDRLPVNLNCSERCVVVRRNEIIGHLHKMGVQDAVLTPADTRIRVLHYVNGQDLYYFVNEGTNAWQGDVHVPVPGDCCLYDAWENTLLPADYDPSNEGTTLHLTVEPCKSAIVLFGRSVFTLLMAFGNIFGQGGASLISRQLGKGNKNAVRHVSAFSFYITILLGAIAAVFMLLLRDPILSLLGAAEGTWEHASAYYTCLAIGAPAIMLSFIHSNLLRSEGLSKESMIGTVGGALVNIVLDPILISGLQMGAKGAAIATVIGYLCADVFFVIIVHHRSRLFSMKPSEMNIPGNSLIQILGIGIPAAIVNVMQSVSVVMVNQFLLPYGSDRIAAMGIVLKVNLIATLILTGFTFGAQPMFGYYYGSGDHRRFQELSSFCMKFIGILSFLLTAVLFSAAGILAAQAIADAITFVIAASLYAMQLSPRMSRRVHHA